MDKHPQTSHISVCLMSDKLHISNSLIGMKYCHFILHYMQLSSFPSHIYIFKYQVCYCDIPSIGSVTFLRLDLFLSVAVT